MSTEPVAGPSPKSSKTPHMLGMLIGLPIAGITWMLLTGSMPMPHRSGSFSAGVVIALLLVCTITDLRWMKIYNWATYPAFLLGLGFHLFTPLLLSIGGENLSTYPLGNVSFFEAITGAILCFFGVFIVYQGSGIRGAGDVKLATALGAWLGLQEGLLAILYTYAVAGLILSQWVIWEIGPIRLLKHCSQWFLAVVRPVLFRPPEKIQLPMMKRPVPMGFFFLLGTLIALSGVIIK